MQQSVAGALGDEVAELLEVRAGPVDGLDGQHGAFAERDALEHRVDWVQTAPDLPAVLVELHQQAAQLGVHLLINLAQPLVLRAGKVVGDRLGVEFEKRGEAFDGPIQLTGRALVDVPVRPDGARLLCLIEASSELTGAANGTPASAARSSAVGAHSSSIVLVAASRVSTS
ncbi:hypothetical protein [Amycolatopsis japonica]